MHIPWAHVLVMCCIKVFREVICKVFFGWVPLHIKLFVQYLVRYPEKSQPVNRDGCFFTLSFTIPGAVLMSQCTGVGGCRRPSSTRASRSTLPSLMSKKSAPNSASATEHTTIRSMPHETNMLPLIWMCATFLGALPKKK